MSDNVYWFFIGSQTDVFMMWLHSFLRLLQVAGILAILIMLCLICGCLYRTHKAHKEIDRLLEERKNLLK